MVLLPLRDLLVDPLASVEIMNDELLIRAVQMLVAPPVTKKQPSLSIPSLQHIVYADGASGALLPPRLPKPPCGNKNAASVANPSASPTPPPPRPFVARKTRGPPSTRSSPPPWQSDPAKNEHSVLHLTPSPSPLNPHPPRRPRPARRHRCPWTCGRSWPAPSAPARACATPESSRGRFPAPGSRGRAQSELPLLPLPKTNRQHGLLLVVLRLHQAASHL